jgi:hypothetical protein
LGFVSVGGVFGLVVVGVVVVDVVVVGVVVVGVVVVDAGVFVAGGVVCVGGVVGVVVVGMVVVSGVAGGVLGALWADRRRVLLCIVFVVSELLGAVAGTRIVLVTGTFTLTIFPLGSTRRTVVSRCATTRF